MKLAIITTGNFSDMKGVMNYVQEESLRFQAVKQVIKTDTFFIINNYSILLAFLYKCLGKQVNRVPYRSGDIYNKDGVNYILLVRQINLLNILFTIVFKQFIPNKVVDVLMVYFKDYDAMITHQLPCHYLAKEIKRKLGIPYITTWHGSDINVSPKQSLRIFNVTKNVMEEAAMNYFVSKGLMVASNYITQKANKDYIYTGPSSIFRKYSDYEKNKLRQALNVQDKKVVMFVGNLIPIKNVLVLPLIFSLVSKKYKEKPIEYWIIGNGVLQDKLNKELSKLNIDYKMLGKKDPQYLPKYMNVADILVVPSKNEGFSLVTLEARTCGCYVVASNVGGLPESAGEENCFTLDDNFTSEISNKIVGVLTNDLEPTPLPEEMSWDAAIKKEIVQINQIIEHKMHM